MVKELKIKSNGIAKNVFINSDEMLLIFDNMLNQFAHQCVSKTAGYQGCVEQFDDYKQMASIKAIEKFNSYDSKYGTCFSTILFKALRGLMVDTIRKNDTKMRNSKQGLVFIDSKIGESNGCVGDILADTRQVNYFENDSTDLELFLIKNMTREEIMFYTVGLKKQVNKSTTRQRVCLEHTIECFSEVVDNIPDKKEELAQLLGISRPTLNKRIKETTSKVKKLAIEFCLQNNINDYYA